jgi:hypothetical protein
VVDASETDQLHVLAAIDDELPRFVRHSDLYALEAALLKAARVVRAPSLATAAVANVADAESAMAPGSEGVDRATTPDASANPSTSTVPHKTSVTPPPEEAPAPASAPPVSSDPPADEVTQLVRDVAGDDWNVRIESAESGPRKSGPRKKG